MNQLITVILPVYNGEKYLNRAIDSVINQTLGFNNICLLAINDGGQDSSLEILQDYQQKFPELIQVINQENQGVAKTRNQAIQLVETTYLTFLDQDDYFDLDFLETLYKAAVESDAEVVSSGYNRPNSQGKIIKTVQPNQENYSKYLIMAAWSKLHQTQFIKNNEITFFDNPIGEDLVFTVKELLNSKKWIALDYTGYNWFYNEKSVSNTAQQHLNLQTQSALYRLEQKLLTLNQNNDYNFYYFMLRTIVFYLLLSGKNSELKIFEETFKEMFEKLNKFYKFALYFKKPKGESIKIHIILVIINLVYRLKLVSLFAKIYCKGETRVD